MTAQEVLERLRADGMRLRRRFETLHVFEPDGTEPSCSVRAMVELRRYELLDYLRQAEIAHAFARHDPQILLAPYKPILEAARRNTLPQHLRVPMPAAPAVLEPRTAVLRAEGFIRSVVADRNLRAEVWGPLVLDALRVLDRIGQLLKEGLL